MGYLDQLKSIQKSSKNEKVARPTLHNQKQISSTDRTRFVDPLDIKSTILPERYTREADPAVKRLKELRKQKQLEEDAKRGGSLKVRNQMARAKSKSPNAIEKDLNAVKTRFRKKIENKLQNMSNSSLPKTTTVKEKKLSFEELMAKAEQVSSSPVVSAPVRTTKAPAKKPVIEISSWKKKKKTSPVMKDRRNEEALARKPDSLVKISSTFQSGPSKKILKKLQKKAKYGESSSNAGYRHEEDEYDSELDDFIEEDDPGYDRSEIWRLMSNGKSQNRKYEFDDDSDDMEANGLDILEEEEASRKMARLEDKKEEQWLKKHDEDKRRKLGRK